MSIFVNSIEKNYQQNVTILQYLKFNGFDVPRFCFHEKLDIAGNCRMCLVEIEGVAKPVASCTLKITDNISIYTNSVMVRKARQAVLESLLLSHPLDCPICDQGGECDLQDQTLLYGPDRGRFFSRKKTVYDFYIGPFVKTTMTRCINCTRCVRFVSFFSVTSNKNTSSLGHIGRGSEVYIGQYLSRFLLNSELSGNIIDLCPVGALTSETYSFTARPWEAVNFNSFDIFDTTLTKIRVDVKDNQILRILPSIDNTPHYFYNEWITDLTRFSFDGYFNSRLLIPLETINYISNKKTTISKKVGISWESALVKLYKRKNLLKSYLRVFLGEFLDLEFLTSIRFIEKFYKTQKTSRLDIFSIDNGIFYNLPFFDFRNQFYSNSFFFENIKDTTRIFSFGVDLRLEMPIHHLVLRQKLKLKYDAFIMGFGSKSLTTNNIFSNNLKNVIKFFEGKSYICNFFKEANNNFLVFNNVLFKRYDSFSLYYMFTKYSLYFSNIVYNIKSTTILNNFDIGLHTNKNTQVQNKKTNLDYSFNVHFNTNLYYSGYLSNNDQSNGFNLYVGSHLANNVLNYKIFNMYLPTTGFFERSCSFFNEFGFLQKSEAIINMADLSYHRDGRFYFFDLFLLAFGLDFSVNEFFFKEVLSRLIPLDYKYNLTEVSYNCINFNYFVFYIVNTPFITLIADSLFNSNGIAKNSVLMHIAVNNFESEQDSIYY